MGRFRQKLMAFMAGRYGIDALYYVLFVGWLVLFFVSCFTFVRENALVYALISVVMWLLILAAILRAMSRNIVKRRRENELVLRFWRTVKSFFRRSFLRIKEIRTHRYRKCPHCKSWLRLPRKTGTHNVRCPRCGKAFKVKVLF